MNATIEKMKLEKQTAFALDLLGWHGGQSSALYAVGSCMLSDSNKGVLYRPENHHGHADTDEETGALYRAMVELKRCGSVRATAHATKLLAFR